jgi:hypothetical protein
MIALMAAVIVLASAQNAAAPSAKAVPEPRQISDEAMASVAADDMKGLFKVIARHMPMKPDELDAIRVKMVDMREALPGKVGKVLGYAFISECRKSDILVRYTYVEKREKSVVRWQFLFYKPRSTWQMLFFYMDEDLGALFQPCA